MADLLPPVQGFCINCCGVHYLHSRAPDQLHKDPATDAAAIDFGVASIEMHFGV